MAYNRADKKGREEARMAFLLLKAMGFAFLWIFIMTIALLILGSMINIPKLLYIIPTLFGLGIFGDMVLNNYGKVHA